MSALTSPHRPMRPAAVLCALATLLLPAQPAAAIAAASHRPTPAQHGACRSPKGAGRRSHRSTGHSCKSRARKQAARKHAGPTRRTAIASPELVAATCEDGTLPSHAGGGTYSCEDGSAPSCESGKLLTGAATTQPMCAVKPPEKEGPAVEYACEAASESNSQPGCETTTEPEPVEAEDE